MNIRFCFGTFPTFINHLYFMVFRKQTFARYSSKLIETFDPSAWGKFNLKLRVCNNSTFRSRPSQVFFKIIVLKSFANSQANTSTQLFFLLPSACKFIKKRLRSRRFPVSFGTFLKRTF